LFIIDEGDINEEWQILSHNINNALNKDKDSLNDYVETEGRNGTIVIDVDDYLKKIGVYI